MPYYESPPTWLLGIVAALIIGALVFGSQLISYFSTRPGRAARPAQGERPARPARPAQGERSKRSMRSYRRSARSAHSRAVQPVQPVQPIRDLQSPAGQLPETPEELARLVRAVGLIAGGASEQSALESSFEIKKGGGAGWRRAKGLLDTVRQAGQAQKPQ